MKKKRKITEEEFYSVDSPPIPTEMIRKMRPHKELFPDWPDRITRGPQKAPKKEQVTIRLSPEVVEHFKSGGKGWQTRINQVLQEYVETSP